MESAQNVNPVQAMYDQWQTAQKQWTDSLNQSAQQFQNLFGGNEKQPEPKAQTDAQNETQNQFQRWIDLQQQTLKQFNDWAQKMQKFDGNPATAQQNFQDWIQFQNQLTEQWGQMTQSLFQQPQTAQPLIENWLDAQQKMFKQFEELSGKVVDAASFEQGQKWLTEWQANQQKLIDQFNEQSRQFGQHFQNLPGADAAQQFFQQWLESVRQYTPNAQAPMDWQKQAFEQWQNWQKQFQPQPNPADWFKAFQPQPNPADWFKAFQPQPNPAAWFKAFQPQQTPAQQWEQFQQWQQQGMQNWKQAFEQFQNQPNNPFQQWAQAQQNPFFSAFNLGNLYGHWNDIVHKALGSFGQPENAFNPFKEMADQDIMHEAFKNMNGTVQNSFKVYEHLAPMLKAMQERVFDPKNISAYTNPAKTKELVDRLFEFTSPQSILEFQETLKRYGQTFETAAQKNADRMANVFRDNMALIADAAKGDPAAVTKMYTNVAAAMQQTADPFISNWQAEGKWDDVAREMHKISGKMTGFVNKLSEYQYAMYNAGQQAMEQVVKKMADDYVEGKEPKNFNEVLKLWIDNNDQSFGGLFRTDEFSRVQAEMMDAGMEIKIDFQNVLEILMADLPIATRSELDNMSKNFVALQRRIRELEAELDELRAEAPAAKTPAAKKTKTAEKE